MFVRFGWISAALCLGASSVAAQPLADRAPLRGTVVDDAGQPVAALISVRRQEDTGATSFWGGEARADAGGRFLLPQAQEGRYFLNLEAPGHSALVSVPIEWSRQSPPLRLSLPRLTRALLHITRSDGTPLSSAPVWIGLLSPGVPASSVRVSTDSRGDALVPDIAPATYSLLVVSANGVGMQNAVPLAWKEGGTRLDVRLSEGATVKVQALDAKGQPLGGASLVLSPRSPEEAVRLGGLGADISENWALNASANVPQAIVVHDREGTLELKGVPAGQYAARLTLPGYASLSRDIETREGEVVEWKAEFPARRAATLVFDVRGADGKPAANSLVALRLLPLSADGTFAPAPLTPFGGAEGEPNNPFAPPPLVPGSGGRVGRTDGEGKLTLFPVQAGRYRVFASRPTSDEWLRSPVAREGAPLDVNVSLDGPNAVSIQVP